MDENGGEPAGDGTLLPVPVLVVLDQSVSPGAKLLWMQLYLVQRTGERPFEMKIQEIMTLTGSSKGSIQKYRKELIEAGWLEETALRGLALTNLYEVKVPGQQVHSPAELPEQ